MHGVLGGHQMAVAAIDDARCARHAAEAHVGRQGEVGDDIGAGRQEHRNVAVGRLAEHLGEGPALVVERAGPHAEIGGADRAAHRGEFDALQARRQAANSGSASPATPASADRLRRLRLFNIGTVSRFDARASQETCQPRLAGNSRPCRLWNAVALPRLRSMSRAFTREDDSEGADRRHRRASRKHTPQPGHRSAGWPRSTRRSANCARNWPRPRPTPTANASPRCRATCATGRRAARTPNCRSRSPTATSCASA